jgi:hypothetical protein
MNCGNVRFDSFVIFEMIDDLEERCGGLQETCLELKHRRQIAGAMVVGECPVILFFGTHAKASPVLWCNGRAMLLD